MRTTMTFLLSWCSSLVAAILVLRICPVRAQLADQQAMAVLHDALSVPDWGPRDSDYCSWRGVTCGGPNGTVEVLLLPHRGLSGNISPISELSGPIPLSLGALRRLRSLNLSNNLFSGEIPGEFGNLGGLQELHISGNNLSGFIPRWVGDLPYLRVFSAYENNLEGRIPEHLGSVSQLLQVLNLHSNRLTGPIPESIFAGGRLEVLVLTLNELEGSLPPSIGNCSSLSNLRIGNNRLAGAIPATIGDIQSLTYFEADNNFFSGEIIPEFSRCSNLTLLNLASNRFTGDVPAELGALKNLQEFIASGNSLTGGVPRPLLQCRSLSKLDLNGNRLSGSLPDDLCNTSRLQFLLLGDNSITGEIPREIGDCVKLLELQLGGNHLTGNVPPEIGSLRNLQIALNLSFNQLEGPLPKEMGRLDKLVSLDISDNRLTGRIPPELIGMLSLIDVDFSNNQFTGQIPIFAPFQKSPLSSFSGNEGLCGDPSNLSCDISAGSGGAAAHRKVSSKMALAVIVSGLTAFTMVTLVVLLFMLRERQEMAAHLKHAVDLDCVVRATMKDENKLGGGAFSTVYRAVMPSGLTLAVKRLKSVDGTVARHRNRMIRELERFSSLAQPNLLRPIGFVIHEDVALLLHHHTPEGTLAQLLYGRAGGEFLPDWPRRLRIAAGAAEGLAYLHQASIVHLDISSCNIFLDADHNALLGEIEISKLLDPSKGTASISAVAGSFGYIPPYAYTMQVTAAGNVYSYGVVLLEMLTSRAPVEESFGEGMDLVKWVRSAAERGEMPEQIMDPRLSAVSFAWRRQMLAVLRLAMLCTDPTPATRPRMKAVVQMVLQAQKDSLLKSPEVDTDDDVARLDLTISTFLQ
ncbi:unnamed protein product [Spirodela intermedia]|uniref:Protein kinase domain-containing protein n=1 Tax=Spirodela intermedia TaxID=51605 RepID=A0A7I8IMX9_SPIIN|nr:unnamed protein product [Spirodela intermedia]CAA6659149.1 unnamed protein product [Spirodela intermedia]